MTVNSSTLPPTAVFKVFVFFTSAREGKNKKEVSLHTRINLEKIIHCDEGLKIPADQN